MVSKYDNYWRSRIEGIKRLLNEAYTTGSSGELDVSDIRSYGERDKGGWYGVVEVYKDHIEKHDMAHARSLGKVMLAGRVLDPYESSGFRMVISKHLKLVARRLDVVAEPVPVSAQPAAPSRESPSGRGLDLGSLWDSALANPLPLFKTATDDPLVAVFDDKGFFLSEEAQRVYDRIKSLPHIYVARLEPENAHYFGISNQSGGRWKRSHAYHLGGLAYEILGTKRYDDQDHSSWVRAWFEPFQRERRGPHHTIRMKEEVVISLFAPRPQASKAELETGESRLIAAARRKGLVVLNKRG